MEDEPDVLGVLFAGDEFVVNEVVSVGDAPAHEHAEPERGAYLVANAVSDHLPLELRERGEDVHDHAPGGVRCVELLRDGDESDLVLLQNAVNPREVAQGSGEPVDLVDDDYVDLFVPYVLDHLLERGAVRVAAREPAVAVFLLEAPAVGGLAFDVRECGVALCIERVVFLVEPLLGRLAHIDGASFGSDLLRHSRWFLCFQVTEKKAATSSSDDRSLVRLLEGPAENGTPKENVAKSLFGAHSLSVQPR